jgi:tRNA G46 methylase TrmB
MKDVARQDFRLAAQGQHRTSGDPSSKAPFQDLGLQLLRMEKRRRVRQHTNPFKPSLQQPAEFDPARAFDDPEKPLLVDVGCGPGRFAVRLALRHPEYNVLALDIREPLIHRANWCATAALYARTVHEC